ncbi:MAG TPA: hypothetical protein VM052_01500, partial [Candidatus Limnocylindrales bacterium]|nr:hypothetical protein [Candidatus Limnocylindrales bacterium]
ALSLGMGLTVMTADQLDGMPTALGPNAIVPWLTTFVRMYLAIGLFAGCLAVPYVLGRRTMLRPRREHP